MNHQNILYNICYIGKVIYSDNFADGDVTEKCKEIINFFYGKNIYEQVLNTKIYINYDINGYKNITLSGANVIMFIHAINLAVSYCDEFRKWPVIKTKNQTNHIIFGLFNLEFQGKK